MTSNSGESRLAEGHAEDRVALVGRLKARRAEIAEAIFARISDAWFEQTGRKDPEYVAGLRAAGEAALDYVLAGIEGGSEFLEPVPEAAMAQARRAARAGVGLDTVLRRYIAGRGVIERFIVQEAGRGTLGGREWALGEALQILSKLTERVTAAVGAAHRRECERCERSGESSAGGGPDAGLSTEGPRTELTGAQRERILGAIVEVVAERGYAGATVGAIAERARVGRPTFYRLFPGGLDEGLSAVIDHGLERSQGLVARAFAEHECRREAMRTALASVLALFDSEPQLARVLMVDTLAGGPPVLEHRARAVAAFRQLVITQVGEELSSVSPLAAEGTLAAVMEIVRSHLISLESEPLVGLLGPLLGLIAEPFVGRGIAGEEMRQGERLARALEAEETGRAATPLIHAASESEKRMILTNSTAQRPRECLLYLAEHPDASNSAVGVGIGVKHRSQISVLLAQLEEKGLVVKRSAGLGVANRWRLTAHGEELASRLAE